MTRDRVRAVQDRRRSNAAGPHTSTQTRAHELDAALADWIDDFTNDEQPSHSTCTGTQDQHDSSTTRDQHELDETT